MKKLFGSKVATIEQSQTPSNLDTPSKIASSPQKTLWQNLTQKVMTNSSKEAFQSRQQDSGKKLIDVQAEKPSAPSAPFKQLETSTETSKAPKSLVSNILKYRDASSLVSTLVGNKIQQQQQQQQQQQASMKNETIGKETQEKKEISLARAAKLALSESSPVFSEFLERVLADLLFASKEEEAALATVWTRAGSLDLDFANLVREVLPSSVDSDVSKKLGVLLTGLTAGVFAALKWEANQKSNVCFLTLLFGAHHQFKGKVEKGLGENFVRFCVFLRETC
jgi:hypothetical protein